MIYLGGHSSCSLCLLATERKRVVPGAGYNRAILMFVGESPGAQEEEEGTPFVGPAGQLLRSILREEGIDDMTCFFSNLVHCRPPNNQYGAAIAMGAGICAPTWLDQEIEAVDPFAIVAVGAQAGRRLLGLPETMPARECVTHSGETPCTGQRTGSQRLIVCCYHPSFALRSGEKAGEKEGWIIESMRGVIRRAHSYALNAEARRLP